MKNSKRLLRIIHFLHSNFCINASAFRIPWRKGVISLRIILTLLFFLKKHLVNVTFFAHVSIGISWNLVCLIFLFLTRRYLRFIFHVKISFFINWKDPHLKASMNYNYFFCLWPYCFNSFPFPRYLPSPSPFPSPFPFPHPSPYPILRQSCRSSKLLFSVSDAWVPNFRSWMNRFSSLVHPGNMLLNERLIKWMHFSKKDTSLSEAHIFVESFSLQDLEFQLSRKFYKKYILTNLF